MAWTVVAGIDAPATERLGPELITCVYGIARIKQLFLHEEHESLNTEATHAMSGDLTGSDPQLKPDLFGRMGRRCMLCCSQLT